MPIATWRIWLAEHWVAGAGFMAAGLLATTPLLAFGLSLPLILIFLHSPAYMVHQVEEHTDDRFRSFFNDRMFGGRDALRVIDVLVVNMPLVWGLNLSAVYAALLWGPGLGLVAPYAMLVNAIVHIVAMLRLRIYNPGLVTAIVLFLPLSLITIVVVGRVPSTAVWHHVLGFVIAVALHAAIVVSVLIRLRRQAAQHAG